MLHDEFIDRPCCTDSDCDYCHGSGLVTISKLEDLAMEVLCMVRISDLNQPDCVTAIRRLARGVLKKV